MRPSFRGLATLSAMIFFALTWVWLFAPNVLLSDWGVELNTAVGLVGRRVAALHMGLGVMFLAARNVEPSPGRTALIRGVVVTYLMLAALGIYELGAGRTTPNILLAVAIEVSLTLAFLYVGRLQPLRSDSQRARKKV